MEMKPPSLLTEASFKDLILSKGLDSFEGVNHLPIVKESIKAILEENVFGGKMTRGNLLIDTVNPSLNSKNDNVCLLAWLIEILQTSFLIADDIMDAGEERRGKKCWYRIVGLGALNDSFILQSFINSALRVYSFDYRMIELFDRVKMHTEIGQLIDMRWSSLIDDTKPIGFGLLEKLKDVYDEICYKKTAYYTIYLPIVAGLIYMGDEFVNEIEIWTPIMLEVGHFFQMQDDYLDIFGDPSLLGKAIRKDVLEGKCTWPLITSIKYLLLKEDYSSLQVIHEYLLLIKEGKKICQEMNNKIIGIYIDIPLEEEFIKEEEKISKMVKEFSSLRSNDHCSALIGGLVEKLTGRKK